MKKIAILESYKNRGKLIKEVFLKVDKNLDISIFKVYNNDFPDFSYDGYIISGGIITLSQKDKYSYLLKIEKFIISLSSKNKSLLGICLGHQLIGDAFGGKVREAKKLEVGFVKIKPTNNCKLFEGILNDFYVFNYHLDFVSEVPKNFEVIAVSDICTNHIMKHKTKPIFGFQFHIEYDKKTSIPVLEYLKDEIIEKGLDYGEILNKNELFNEKIILRLIKNFLSFC